MLAQKLLSMFFKIVKMCLSSRMPSLIQQNKVSFSSLEHMTNYIGTLQIKILEVCYVVNNLFRCDVELTFVVAKYH